MTFQLDTSSAVHGVIASDGDLCAYLWSDLSPFTQGYIEALLQPSEATHYSLTDRFAGFSDLAPETLARIIADCEGAERSGYDDTTYAGAIFWRERQDGHEPPFPPLTVQLGDDGKVRFSGVSYDLSRDFKGPYFEHWAAGCAAGNEP